MKKILKNIGTFIIIFLSLLIFYSTIWMIKTFGDISVDEIVFNIKVPMNGVNTDYIFSYIKSSLFPSILLSILICLILLYKLKKKIFINIGLYNKQIVFELAPLKYIKKFPLILAIILFTISCNYSVKALNLSEYAKNELVRSTFIEHNYKDPSTIKLSFPQKKRNLIYIYMESMEYTYASEEEGGYLNQNAIPQLTEIAKENVNFSSTEKLGGLTPSYGATWTMGAIFAQTTGLPLKLPIYGNDMDQYSSFMPGVKNLGDILEENGYHNMLMIGSDAKYAGRKNFFEQHGNYEIYDYYSAIDENKIDKSYHEWWGYEDRKLFKYAKEKLLNLSDSKQPFNFTMLTADTHFEDGYSCPLCQNKFGKNQYENVIACSSKQISEFVNWIQAQDFYKNTTIVLVGDHTTMDTKFCDNVNVNYKRGVYDAFINAPIKTEKFKNRYATTMDMFPTTLASLGVTITGDKLGLGTNLFSNKKTILEENNNDISKINDELRKKSSFYDKKFLYSSEDS